MITLSKTRLGKFVAQGVGRITSDPVYKTVGKDEKQVCQFFLQSDVTKTGQTKNYESFNVSVWGDDAVYASQLEKNDKIFIIGECKKDEYWSNRNGKDEFSITADMIFPTNIGVTVLQLQMAMQAMNESSDSASKPTIANKESDGFYDYSNLELPEEFRDIEPDI